MTSMCPCSAEIDFACVTAGNGDVRFVNRKPKPCCAQALGLRRFAYKRTWVPGKQTVVDHVWIAPGSGVSPLERLCKVWGATRPDLWTYEAIGLA